MTTTTATARTLAALGLPDPCLIALIGAPGTGKSTFAGAFDPDDVLNADHLRGLASGDRACQAEAVNGLVWTILHALLDSRLGLRRPTVIDATSAETAHRAELVVRAQRHEIPAYALVLDTPLDVALARNTARDRRVSEDVVRTLHEQITAGLPGLADEGFAGVLHASRISLPTAAADGGEGTGDRVEVVPAGLRDWAVSWPQYAPLDVTPPELLPQALAAEVPAWAEGAATPADVTNWDQRRADALVPFELDHRGWPLHPAGRTGRSGRNLGRWGENAAADPIVIAGAGVDRRILLITRDDIGVEAIPGGMVDAGETAPQALVRELHEETGVDLRGHQPVILGTGLVDDWRQSDHAWVASTSALYVLPATVTATAADDALDATWYPAGTLAELEAAIAAAGRTLYAAHRPLITRALAHLAQQ
ncbi:AAA family ATPase [Kitasatospora sp. NPDC058063]|uniref:AAA family ATPase n=1 Tax=unclassified Kitasatospora TaxID=2633591 RepID=UPI0036DCFE3D